MTRSKGQSIVEFAFIAPMLVFMLISIIYVGITFLDYTQYNNAARDAARDISLQTQFENKKKLVDRINKPDPELLKRYATHLTNLYTATWHAALVDDSGSETGDKSKAEDVHITINLERDELPSIFESLHILPKHLKAIEYKMKLENN